MQKYKWKHSWHIEHVQGRESHLLYSGSKELVLLSSAEMGWFLTWRWLCWLHKRKTAESQIQLHSTLFLLKNQESQHDTITFPQSSYNVYFLSYFCNLFFLVPANCYIPNLGHTLPGCCCSNQMPSPQQFKLIFFIFHTLSISSRLSWTLWNIFSPDFSMNVLIGIFPTLIPFPFRVYKSSSGVFSSPILPSPHPRILV